MTLTTETPAEKLAFEFAKEIFKEVGLQGLQVINYRNKKETLKAVCHSHEVCDAHELLCNAYETTFGVHPTVGDTTTCMEAWDIAKANQFYYKDFAQGQENYKD